MFYVFQNTTASPKNPTAKLLSQPSISITPLPRTTSQSSIPGSGTSSKPGGKATFVICEICDGYIKVSYTCPLETYLKDYAEVESFTQIDFVCSKLRAFFQDLEQLRNHMQWIHKVKIHPKMIYNRPPLNCQKCQFRFFTDQVREYTIRIIFLRSVQYLRVLYFYTSPQRSFVPSIRAFHL